MFAGMVVLGVPATWAINALGLDWADAPALTFVGMATTMTVPVVAWMLYRRHGWRANAEMSASMFVATFSVIGFLWAALPTATGTLTVIEHVAMLLALVGVMLMRPAEHPGHAEVAV